MSEQISQNKKVHFVDYAGWYQEEREELEPKIIDVIKRGELILRQEVRSFENNLAKYVGTKYAVGTSSGTDAIRLALIASGIKPGDEVITSTHTFAATVAAISQAGGVPVLADIKQEDYLIDVNSVKCLITDKTKFIIPVSLNGRVADMEELEILADEQGITIIEDSAQALGAYRNSRSSGSFGLAGCFSFFPAKTLGSLGDAGAVTTKSKSLYEKIISLRNHGRDTNGDIPFWGFNNRLDNLQAVILEYRLSRIPLYLEKRRNLASLYQSGLKHIPQVTCPPNDRNEGMINLDVFQNYEICVDDRTGLRKYLDEHGIETMVPWGGKPIHKLSAFNGKKSHLEKADYVFGRNMYLPMYVTLKVSSINYIVSVISSYYGY